VFGLVTVDAQVFPVGAVGRVVVVVAVLVVHGEQVQRARVELAGTTGADPAVEGEGTLAVALLPGPGGLRRLAVKGVPVPGRVRPQAASWTKAPGCHGNAKDTATSMPVQQGGRLERGAPLPRSERGAGGPVAFAPRTA